MNSTLPRKFKFNQLVWPIYRRFLELLFQEDTNFSFSLTNRKNYINSVKFRGINIEFDEFDDSFMEYLDSLLQLVVSSDDGFLKNVQKLSKFIPYLRVEYVVVFTYHTELTKFLLPKTYKKLEFININSIDHIDHVADVYYHEDIQFIEGRFMPGFTNSDLYGAINHAINRMPVKDYVWIQGDKTQDTVDNFIKALQIPDVVRSIIFAQEKDPNSYDEKWKIVC